MTRSNHPDVERVRRMYRRVLAAWASDVLRLRRLGLDKPPGVRPAASAVLRRAA